MLFYLVFLLNAVPFPFSSKTRKKNLFISLKYIKQLVNQITSKNNFLLNALHYKDVCHQFLKMILIMKPLLQTYQVPYMYVTIVTRSWLYGERENFDRLYRPYSNRWHKTVHVAAVYMCYTVCAEEYKFMSIFHLRPGQNLC